MSAIMCSTEKLELQGFILNELSNLPDRSLDWIVAKLDDADTKNPPNYCTDVNAAWPIIFEHKMYIGYEDETKGWYSACCVEELRECFGLSPLVAAMRAYASAKIDATDDIQLLKTIAKKMRSEFGKPIAERIEKKLTT